MSDVLENLRIVGGPKLVRELIELFVRSAPERIAAARAGIENGDLDATQRAMHSLKSSAGQLGITAIQDSCRRAEISATNRDAMGAGSALAQVEALWPATCAWLTEQGRL
ncbi:MAG TPA: Hpt domain-containing protein [Gemmatimonadaceae bacterium]|nr:Hpt domain-containing protein [Gemmatimonadaceae bacterium]